MVGFSIEIEGFGFDLSKIPLLFSVKASQNTINDQGNMETTLLTLSMPGFQKLAQAGGRNPPPS